MSDALFRIGARRMAETLFEGGLPLALLGGVAKVTHGLLVTPTATRPFTTTELGILLGGVAAVTSWYAARQAWLVGVRNPWRLLVASFVLVAVVVGGLAFSTRVGFSKRCQAAEAQAVHVRLGEEVVSACQKGAVPDNPYLPGVLLRAPWSGRITPGLGLLLVGITTMTTLGMRDFRLRPSRLGHDLERMLRLSPAAGPTACHGGPAPDGRIQACGNPTLWGELCGQVYPESKVFEPGEWCIRCAQVYRKADRMLEFTVVGLATADIDVLNGLERIDAVVWDPDVPMPPDARLSGRERWLVLGRIRVPDVLTVATLLAHVHDSFGRWEKDAAPDVAGALGLAKARASRVAAWIWFGGNARPLTYARPTSRTMLAVGSARLRDLMLDVGEELYLQLDIGLLPIELRTGFRQTFLDAGREPIVQNSKQDLWVRTAPKTPPKSGLWVPRLEGDALRAWLSLDRIRPDDALGVTSPLPYAFTGDTERPRGSGPVDLVRMPFAEEEEHPIRVRRPGDSLAEWTWLEWQLIEALRQECLVMVAP